MGENEQEKKINVEKETKTKKTKHKLVKVILILIGLLVIAYFIFVMRNYYIMNKIKEKASTYKDVTNYTYHMKSNEIESTTIQDDSTIRLEFSKLGKNNEETIVWFDKNTKEGFLVLPNQKKATKMEFSDVVANAPFSIATNVAMEIELDGKIRKIYGTKKEKIYRQEDIILGFFDRPHIKDYMYGPFNKLFLRELLGNLRFNTSLRMGEDFLFVFQYLSCCRTICILDECLYVYVKRPNSAMTATFNDKRMDYIKSVEIIENMCKECYPYVLKKALAWGYVHRFNTCNQLDKYPKLRQRYQVQYNKMRKYLKINKCLKASLSVKIKVKIWIKSISDKKFHL